MPTHYKGPEKEKLALEAYIKLARAADSVSARINQHLAEVDLTVSQFGVLEALYHLGPMHQNQLAEKILKSTGNITMVVDNLVKRQLVERKRDLEDRRSITIHLTEGGQQLMQELFPRHVAGVVEEMEILEEVEQAQLAALCRKVGRREA
jgi:MarR family 2-MHQ and catechol resistance regulon transcriptional repressor